MKNMKRIFAIFGVIILVALYLSTLVFALIGSPFAMDCLKASVGFTIVIPGLLWIYIAMFKYMGQRKQENSDASEVDGDDNL